MIRDALILAAGSGNRLGGLAQERPKGFLVLGSRPIVEESVLRLFRAGIERVWIVTGYRHEHYLELAGRHPGRIETLRNERYAESGSLYSLYLARAALTGPLLLLESDLIYEPRALSALLEGPEDAVLVSGPTHAGDEVWVAAREGKLAAMSKDRASLGSEPLGELVGISRISAELFAMLIQDAESALSATLALDYETSGLVAASRKRPISCTLIPELRWAEIDDARHLARARASVYPCLPPI